MFLPLLLAATMSLEDYVTMPQVSAPQWSPDAQRIAYVVTKSDLERNVIDSDIWIIDADGTHDRALTCREGSDTRPRWSPDGSHIAFLSDRGGRNAIYLIDIHGGEAELLTNEPAPIRDFEWAPDGASIAFTRIDEASGGDVGPRVVGERTRQVHLYSIDVESRKTRAWTSGNFSVFSLSWAPDGSAIVIDRGPAPTFDALYDTDLYSVRRNGEMTPLVVRPSIDRGPVYSPDGKWIAFTSGGGNPDWIVEHEVNAVPAAGGPTRVISKAYGRTVDAISWSDDSRAVLAEAPWGTTTQMLRLGLDGTMTKLTDVNGVISDVSVHDGHRAYVYESLTEPPELYADGRRLTHHTDAFRQRQLGETRLIRWRNPKDGLEIEGLLTLPVGYSARNAVPLLTFVHGGPASRFDQSFLGYLGNVYATQVFAAKGYAILRPNPRGSNGYGVAFRRANMRDWGGMDWLDVNAGIDKLIADGIADSKRLGLMGWSYGGYLSAWALAQSDRFAAVSAGAGMSDLLMMQATSDTHGYVAAYFPGMPLDLLRDRSPAWQLKKKPNAKILIQQGENDERVPLSQGTLLYRRLLDLGSDVTMVTYPRSGHSIREPRLRLDVMKRNVELFTSVIPATR